VAPVTPLYPTRNPFPSLATVTIEGLANFSLKGIPTAARPPVERIGNLVERYLEDDVAAREGKAVSVHGGHGSGKTHTLLTALDKLAGVRSDEEKPPLILYVRADIPEPLALYRKLMAQLSLPDLAELVEAALAGYAAEAFTSVRPALTPESASVAEQMRAQPDVVLNALRVNQLSWSDVVGQQEADIGGRIQKRYGRFDRVVRALLEQSTATIAHVWLSGGDLDPDDLRRLGVEGNIEEPTDATLAIHVLAALARAARRPFVLAVDQVEALVETTDGEPVAGNAGWLRGLLEAVASEGGFFVIAISERAWKRLPPDLPMRFGPSEIPVRGLTIKEAEAVLAAYLEPWRDEADATPSVHPFQRDGIRRLLVVSGGNIRRFLQASRIVFERALPEQELIERGSVEAALSAIGQRAPTDAEVRQAVERVLGSRSLPYVLDHDIGGQTVHYAALRGTRTVLIVQLQEALFAKDEADAAIANLDRTRAAQELRVPIVLVVVGYSSPEVAATLEEAASRVCIADDVGDFERDLKRAVRETLDEQPAQDDVLEQRLEELRLELAKLADRRGEEERLVAERLRTVTEDMTQTQRSQQFQTYRQAWSDERHRLDEEIHRVRGERKRADVAQMVELHRTFNRRRVARQRLIVGGAAGLVLAGGVVALGLLAQRVSNAALIGGFVLLVLVALAVFFFLREAAAGEDLEVRTLEDVQQRARDTRGFVGIGSPDPYGRFAAAVTAASQAPIESLLEAAEREPARLVRRRLVSAVVEHGEDGVTAALEARLDPATLSVAVEAGSRTLRHQSPEDVERRLDRLPERPRLVAAIWGATTDPQSFLEDFLSLAQGGSAAKPRVATDDYPLATLAKAYRTDDDTLLARAVGQVPDRVLRRATALLSPLDDEGIGSWYWLERIDDVDDLFIFFRKASFLAASGIGVAQETVP
jgi:Cdc6-like AAA superfamily ATPase